MNFKTNNKYCIFMVFINNIIAKMYTRAFYLFLNKSMEELIWTITSDQHLQKKIYGVGNSKLQLL